MFFEEGSSPRNRSRLLLHRLLLCHVSYHIWKVSPAHRLLLCHVSYHIWKNSPAHRLLLYHVLIPYMESYLRPSTAVMPCAHTIYGKLAPPINCCYTTCTHQSVVFLLIQSQPTLHHYLLRMRAVSKWMPIHWVSWNLPEFPFVLPYSQKLYWHKCTVLIIKLLYTHFFT